MKNTPNTHSSTTNSESDTFDVGKESNTSHNQSSDGLKNPKPSKPIGNTEETSSNVKVDSTTDTNNVVDATTDNHLLSQIKDLQHQLDYKQKMIEQLNADHLRSRADMENYKKRLLKERNDAVEFANQTLISSILEVIDNFDRALHAQEESENATDFTNGISLIYQQLQSILQKDWNVVEIDAFNKEFDPMFHEAVVFEEDKSTKKMIVEEVLQKGYCYKGRVIRHARVKVKKPVE